MSIKKEAARMIKCVHEAITGQTAEGKILDLEEGLRSQDGHNPRQRYSIGHR